MFLTSTPTETSWQTYGIFIIETLVALAVVALAARLITRFAWTRMAKGSNRNRIKVIDRVHLDAKKTLFLIEVDGKGMLLGTGENVTLIDKLETKPHSREKEGKGEV